MTVCIAAICDTGRALIMVADRQFGLGYTSVESKHGKFDNFGPDWYVGFAANNTAYAAEDSWGSSLSDFHAHGKERIPLGTYADVYSKLTAFDLSVELLVAGFGDAARIFRIRNPGVSSEQTGLGFWAIGSGSAAALSSLFSREYNFSMSIEEALMYAYEAKVDAEYATDVGTDTDIFIGNRGATPLRIDDDTQKKTLEPIRKQIEPRKLRDEHKTKMGKINEVEILKRMIKQHYGV
jgi:20S proteasome alpha/beta subunit